MQRIFRTRPWLCLALVVGLTGLAMAAPAAWAQSPTAADPDDHAANASSADTTLANTGTAFTYQGRLSLSGNPVNASCNFQFSLWDAISSGAQIGTTQAKTGVPVDRGYFTVSLDFGADAFNGEARYLAIAVDCGGGGTALAPRVTLNPAPYALALPGLRTQQNATSPNVIGGHVSNGVTSGAYGATIGGGGGSGAVNVVTDNYGTVSGGYLNRAGDLAGTTSDRHFATVGGGMDNIAAGAYSFIGGGTGNRASDNSATVGGGGGNTASNTQSTVCGGGSNTASGNAATVCGGVGNTASGNHSYAAGHRAKATFPGTFVWADTTDSDFTSTTNDQFAVRATGGVVFSTGSAAVQVNGSTVWHAGNDGSGSGLDADLLDAQDGSYYRNASNINAGTLGAAYYGAYADLGAEGYLNNDAAGDLLTRGQSDGRYWMLGGNTVGTERAMGTIDNYALDIRVNNARALRLEPKTTSPNVIGGNEENSASSGVIGATIGGGGAHLETNRVTDAYGAVGGGQDNQAGDNLGTTTDRSFATVGGGNENLAGGYAATVGGGQGNSATGQYATIAGGYGNAASYAKATVGGGQVNWATGLSATIGGGYNNAASGAEATIAGGDSNVASGQWAAIPGGRLNTAAGDYSFAAGFNAKNTDAAHDGVFLFADAQVFDFPSSAANQFRARTTGGTQFVLGIDGAGTPAWSCSAAYGGTWACTSDGNLMANLTPVDQDWVLAQLLNLPIYSWNAAGQSTLHIGPTAQEFYDLYGVGDDNTAIATIDLDGVALAAIQRLALAAQASAAETGALKAQVAALTRQNADLEARLLMLEARTNGGSPLAADRGWGGFGVGLALAGLAAGVVVTRIGGWR